MCCLSVCLVFLFVWSPCSASADSSVAALSVCLSVMSVSSVCLVDLFGLSICLCLCQQLNIDDATPRIPLLCFGLVVTCAREFKLRVRNSLEVAVGADTIFFIEMVPLENSQTLFVLSYFQIFQWREWSVHSV